MLFIGFLLLATSGLLIFSAAQTTLISANRNLDQLWRTSYDILVRPAGSRGSVEEQTGLVQANFLSGIDGGISLEQFELIKKLPGIEVAAPIAILGYINGGAGGEEIELPSEPGLYYLRQIVTVTDGFNEYSYENPSLVPYFLIRDSVQLAQEDSFQQDGINVNPSWEGVNGRIDFPFLVAGILPSEEASLIGLDQTITTGAYLQDNESLEAQMFLLGGSQLPSTINFPVLINAQQYINLEFQIALERVSLPAEQADLENIAQSGGRQFLDTLPRETIATLTTGGADVYSNLLANIAPQFFGITTPFNNQATVVLGANELSSAPSPIEYAVIEPPLGYEGMALSIEIPEDTQGATLLQYRELRTGDVLNNLLLWDPKGVFDIENLPQPDDVTRVPLETYLPPTAFLVFDEDGNAIEPPVELSPTLDPGGYIQSPPLLLTTLDAVVEARGDTAISAIRVRIEGVDDLSPASQRKIEAIAIEIAEQTGLEVDIMVGSSPTRVLVHVPGVGYVEEQWIQKGVNLSYRQGISSGTVLLITSMLVTALVFVFDLASNEIAANEGLIGLQKALGWRSGTLLRFLLREVAVISLAATALGITLALAIINIFGWTKIDLPIIGLTLFTIPLIALLGAVWPALLSVRGSPAQRIQHGGVVAGGTRRRRNFSLWAYAREELRRRPLRTWLTVTAVTLSAALFVVLWATVTEQQRVLSGTLLGEFLIVSIEDYHFVIVAVGFILASLSTTNSLLGSVLSQRGEIALLKTFGWHTKRVAQLFFAQGAMLGFLGGVIGALLGGLVYSMTYSRPSTSLLLAMLFGVLLPSIVGMAASVIPAVLASRISPAEALRHE